MRHLSESPRALVLPQVPNPQECGGQGGCQGATVELGIAWAVQHLGQTILMWIGQVAS